MVLSRIDKSIKYSEIKEVDPEDIGFDASVYELELKPNISGTIALGNVRYTFVDKGILYIPVYLVQGDNVSMQIGVYEFFSSNYTNLLDVDNDFDISLLANPEPLYYSFITESFLSKNAKPSSDDDEDAASESKVEDPGNIGATSTSEKEEIDEILKDIAQDDDDLDEKDETMGDDISERKKFKSLSSHNWIQKFMKNTHYSILDNEGGGDCLFAIIRDAFKGVKDISVPYLRNLVSNAADEKIFDTYKEQYNMYSKIIIKSRKEMAQIVKEINVMRKTKAAEKDRNRQKQIVESAKKKIEDFNRLKRELKHAKEISKDFKFMKNITTLGQFKKQNKRMYFLGGYLGNKYFRANIKH